MITLWYVFVIGVLTTFTVVTRYLFVSTGSWLHKFNHNYVVYSKHLKSCQYFVGDSNNTFFTLSGGCKQQQHKAHGKLNPMKAWVILILDYFVNPFNQSATHVYFTLTASQPPLNPSTILYTLIWGCTKMN